MVTDTMMRSTYLEQVGQVKPKRFLFISTLHSAPWAGCEELWGRAALLLARRGHNVTASVHPWPAMPDELTIMQGEGVRIVPRPATLHWLMRVARRFTPSRHHHRFGGASVAAAAERLVNSSAYDLIVICEAAAWPAPELPEVFTSRNLPFAFLSQANSEEFWPEEEVALRLGRGLSQAKALYFVAAENHRLAECQVGRRLPNSQVVWNPVKFDRSEPLAWPMESGTLRIASVARLYAPQKGQDKLLRALAESQWAQRDWRLTLAGSGPHEGALRRLTTMLGLDAKVEFAGHVDDIKTLWKDHHVHVLPSRHEGMPLAILEAAACGRASLTTRVADHDRIVIDGHTGILCSASTVPALSEALERLWRERENLPALGAAAYDYLRKMMPRDAEIEFADKLEGLAR